MLCAPPEHTEQQTIGESERHDQERGKQAGGQHDELHVRGRQQRGGLEQARKNWRKPEFIEEDGSVTPPLWQVEEEVVDSLATLSYVEAYGYCADTNPGNPARRSTRRSFGLRVLHRGISLGLLGAPSVLP